jgi:hypothetical protein
LLRFFWPVLSSCRFTSGLGLCAIQQIGCISRPGQLSGRIEVRFRAIMRSCSSLSQPAASPFLRSRRLLGLAIADILCADLSREQFYRLLPNQSGEHLHGAIHGHAWPAKLAKPASCYGQRYGGICHEFRALPRIQKLPAY